MAIIPKHEAGSDQLIRDIPFPRIACIKAGTDKLESQVVYRLAQALENLKKEEIFIIYRRSVNN